ncbi:MAG: aldehyde ferredoxin oxidoreductase family protein [Oscillospiraceae bacterium]
MKCCLCKILHVDLTMGVIEERKIPDEVYEKVLSGKGLGAWYLTKHIPAGADPMGPENILGFVSGALTGTGALMCGRWMAVTKSPLTGGWGDANCGGTFSPAIKQCGYDAIFFSGISPKPVYLLVDNKGARLCDAEKYWGMDATQAEEALTVDNTVKKKPCVAVIGQSGEKLSLISGICNEGGRIAARSGVGAVMGVKKLKAVVLAGTKQIPCADSDAVHAISKELGAKLKKAKLPSFVKGGILGVGGKIVGAMPATAALDGMMTVPMFKKWGTALNTPMAVTSGDGPIKNWDGGPRDAKGATKAYNPERLLKRETQKYHCYSCGLGCGGSVDISDIQNGEFKKTHKPEYETLEAFGPLLQNNNLESVLYINELLNRAGMDSISAGNTVAWAVECFEKGIISKDDTDGLMLEWGNFDAIAALVKKMIAREGIGDILADGVKRASERLGGQEYAMHIGGEEPGMHDSRNDPQLAVHFVAEPAPGKHTVGMTQMYGSLNLCDICSWAPAVTSSKKTDAIEPSLENAMKSVANACYTMLTDGAGGCYYGEMMGTHAWNPCKYLNAAAGWDKTGDEYMEIGRRIQTLRQMFNIKHGIKPADWKLPERMAGNPPLDSGPLKNVTLKNDEMVKYHWQGFGWDRETGIPTAETVERLEIPQLLEIGEE